MGAVEGDEGQEVSATTTTVRVAVPVADGIGRVVGHGVDAGPGGVDGLLAVPTHKHAGRGARAARSSGCLRGGPTFSVNCHTAWANATWYRPGSISTMAYPDDCIEELLVALVSVCLEDAVLVEVHPDGGTVVLAGHAEFKPACAGRDEGTGYQVLEAVGPGDFRHGSAERGVVMEVDALVFGAVGELAGAHRVPGQKAAVVVEVQEGVVARVLGSPGGGGSRGGSRGR